VPLAFHCRSTVCVDDPDGAVTPVPLTGTVTVLFVAVLVIVSVPATYPVFVGANCALIIAVCPGAIVVPLLTPVSLKPVPLMPTDDTDRLEFPLFVSVMSLIDVWFTSTFPNEMLLGDTPSTFELPAPVPDNATDATFVPPLSVTVIVPVTLPADSGKNATENCTVEPARNVIGVLIPDTEKPVPVAAMLAIDIFLPVSFCSAITRVFRVPTGTLPKGALVGLTLSEPLLPFELLLPDDDPLLLPDDVPVDELPVPVAESATLASLVPPLSVTARVPETLPAAFGENSTENCTVDPARNVIGTLIPEIENPVPVAEMAEITTFLPSSFFS